MPGFSNADNKFGPSSFVVGTVLGDGCNYTSIQSAINDAFAAGGSSVLIRAGSYTENLTLIGGVDLLAVAGDGRPPTPVVQINGNHTFTSNGFALVQDIGFNAAAGDLFTVTAPPAGFSVIGAKFCRLDAPAGRGCVLTGTGGGAAFISIQSEMNADAEGIIATDASIQLFTSVITSNTANAISLNGSSGINATASSTLNGTTAAVIINSAASNCVSSDCTFSSSNGPSILFNAAGTVANTNTIHGSSGISGFYIEGTGNYQYASDYFNGSNSDIDPLVTVSVYKWKPYGTAGTTLTAVRGTSSFDSTDFTVSDGFVQLAASAADSFPVDNGGPGVPLLGAMSILGSTSTDFPTSSGIETHVGATTNQIYLEDRRWLSEYVVTASASVGSRGTFTTMAAATAAASAAGGGTVYIRPGNYAGAQLWSPNTDLVGVAAAGSQGTVNLSGTISIAGAGNYTATDITFNVAAGAAVAVSTATTVVFTNCTFVAAAGIVFLCTDPGASIRFVNCSIISAGVGAAIDIDGSQIIVFGGSVIGDQIYRGATSAILQNLFLISTIQTVDTASVNTFACQQNAGAASAYNVNSVGSSITAVDCGLASGAGTGFFATGTGTFKYNDITNDGSAINIDPALTALTTDWKPYCTAGTTLTAVRGTSSFDSTQFTVTDGFVQIVSGGGGLTWFDRAVNITVPANTGNNFVGATTLTLPTAPANGTQCAFVVTGGAVRVIQAGGADIIRIGSSAGPAGGTATSSALGDSIYLVYMSSITTWCAIGGPQGNWTLA